MNPKYSFDTSNKIDQISQTFCPKKSKNVRKKIKLGQNTQILGQNFVRNVKNEKSYENS